MGACLCTEKAGVTGGFGLSTAGKAVDAVKEAVAAADIGRPSMAFLSCTVDRDVIEVMSEFTKALPGVPLHGVTSSGKLLQASGGVGNGVGCLLLTGEFAAAADLEGDAAKAAAALKEKMPKPKAIVMGTVPGSEEGAIKAIEAVFGASMPIFGGTAADNELKGDWKVMASEGCSGKGVSLVAVGDSVKFGASMIGPYKATEKTMTATAANGRQVTKLDGKPASDWVYEWLGEAVKEQYETGGLILPQTAQRPIGLKQASGEYVSSHLAALGGGEKTVDFFSPIPNGATLTVMDSGDGPKTGYASTLAEAYEVAKAGGQLSNPKAGLLIYCGGMAIAVGEKLDAGLTGPFKDKVGSLPLLGMTCFGEQAQLPEGKINVQRNLSMGMILFE